MKHRVFHLLGYPVRVGGIIPSVEGATEFIDPDRFEHHLVVRDGYPESRGPRLRNHYVRHLNGEGLGYREALWGAIRFVFNTPFRSQLRPGDLIHSHTRGAMLAAYLLAATTPHPVAIMPHGYGRHRWLYRLGRHRRRIHYACLTRHLVDYYRFTDEGFQFQLLSETCQPRFTVPLGEPGRSAGADGLIRLVGFGSFMPRKRWHQVAEAAARLSADQRARLRIDLFGPVHDLEASRRYHAGVAERIRAAGLESCVRLHEPTDDVMGELAASDWFLLPSIDEPCSVAIIEALSRGVPVIGTSSGGTPEVVDAPKGGRLFRPDRVDELADLLGAIAAGDLRPPPRDQVREVGARRWPQRVARDYETLYDAMLASDG